jgi:hypothetical protein
MERFESSSPGDPQESCLVAWLSQMGISKVAHEHTHHRVVRLVSVWNQPWWESVKDRLGAFSGNVSPTNSTKKEELWRWDLAQGPSEHLPVDFTQLPALWTEEVLVIACLFQDVTNLFLAESYSPYSCQQTTWICVSMPTLFQIMWHTLHGNQREGLKIVAITENDIVLPPTDFWEAAGTTDNQNHQHFRGQWSSSVGEHVLSTCEALC